MRRSVLLAAVLPCATACCKSEFINWQHIDRSIEVGRSFNKQGAILEQLRAALSHVPPTLHRNGLHMEFGVRDGASIGFLANLTGVGTRWHGFDSFLGLPDYGHSKQHKAWKPFTFSRHGLLPDVPENVRLHVGWFNESVPRFLDAKLAAAKDAHVAFMNMDADLYVSTWSVFEAVFSRCMQRVGTVISFDELFGTRPILLEEWRALQEAKQRFGFSYHFVSYAIPRGSPFARSALQLDDCGHQCRNKCDAHRAGE
jgi:hypothetical protein